MNDLINRQEAIDALDRAAECWNIAEPFNEGMKAGYKAAVTIVLSLPSAQPKSYREGYQAGFKDAQPEPCKDAVSRSRVKLLLARLRDAVDDGYGFSYQSAVDELRDMPPAQPERKTGKWINDRGLYKCSCCKQLWAEWWVLSKPIERMRKEVPYCPMCGSCNGGEVSE